MARKTPGIVKRHARSCASRHDRPCNCRPTYEGWVYDAANGRKIRQSFPTEAAANEALRTVLKASQAVRRRRPNRPIQRTAGGTGRR